MRPAVRPAAHTRTHPAAAQDHQIKRLFDHRGSLRDAVGVAVVQSVFECSAAVIVRAEAQWTRASEGWASRRQHAEHLAAELPVDEPVSKTATGCTRLRSLISPWIPALRAIWPTQRIRPRRVENGCRVDADTPMW